jgi:hypothetical protein
MFNRNFIRQHINSLSIVIFLVLFIVIISFKPHFIYNKDGSLRQFGLGYKRKTVIPMWLVTIILAIISYLCVLYYLATPKLKF